jgi:hypothetical protein
MQTNSKYFWTWVSIYVELENLNKVLIIWIKQSICNQTKRKLETILDSVYLRMKNGTMQ